MKIYSLPRIGLRPEQLRFAKTILIIGETGAGKTTMLNAIANYCKQVNYSDDFRYELVDERKLIA